MVNGRVCMSPSVADGHLHLSHGTTPSIFTVAIRALDAHRMQLHIRSNGLLWGAHPRGILWSTRRENFQK